MKVLKEGKWNLVWTKECKCSTCDAELLIEEADVKPTYNCSYFHFVCPICGRDTNLKSGDLPLRVSEAVAKKREWASWSNDK